jgi:Xaa-Pro aminopeptidase
MIFKADTVEEYSLKQNIDAIKVASQKSKKVLEEIISFIQPGIKESEVYQETQKIYQKYMITRSWHNPYIKFGQNTCLTYGEKQIEDLTLQEEDIAFIDIGPIWGDVEGDTGRTIVFGKNKIFEDLRKSSEDLFQLGLEYFRTQNPTGIEMQKFISSKAEELGYEYLLESGGHLIGLFSHGATWNKGIASFDQPIKPGIWILEIHIKHKNLPYAAFFEDILF